VYGSLQLNKHNTSRGEWTVIRIYNMQDVMQNRYKCQRLSYERTREGNCDRDLCLGMKRALDAGGTWGIGRGGDPACLVSDSLMEIGDVGDEGESTNFSEGARGICTGLVRLIWDVPAEGNTGRLGVGIMFVPAGGLVAVREGPAGKGLAAVNNPAFRMVCDLAFSYRVFGAGFFPQPFVLARFIGGTLAAVKTNLLSCFWASSA